MGTPDRLQAARLRATKEWSYLHSCLWSMIPKEVGEEMPFPMAVDKYWRLYYNPSRMHDWTAEQMANVLYHEANHLLRDHPARAERMHVSSDDAQQWNYAADAEINDDLEDEGVELPGKYITPELIKQPRQSLAEVYFRNMPPPDEIQMPQGEGGTGHCDCGSAAGGAQRPWEDGEPSDSSPGVDEGRQLIIKRKTAEQIIEQSQTRGSVPGQWQRWANNIVNPTIPWQRELSAQVRVAVAYVSGKVDYTYRRMSRRQSLSPRIRLPSMRAPAPNIAVVIDTSGSMGDTLSGNAPSALDIAMSELKGVLRSAGVNTGVPVIACDAAIHADRSVFSVNQVVLGGGGGTDMGVGLAHAASLKPRPEIVIVMTDMYTPWPEESPPYRTIVCNVTGSTWHEDSYNTVPDWVTKVIDVNVKEEE